MLGLVAAVATASHSARDTSQGTMVFITLRVTEQDGTQWLRGPDGWLLEKMVLCGQCCAVDSVCHHDKHFVVPFSSAQLQPPSDGQKEPAAVEAEVDIGTLSLQDALPAASPAAVSVQNASPPPSSSVHSSLTSRGQPAVYSRRHLPDRYLSSSGPAARPPFSADLTVSAGEDLAAAQVLLSGMESSLRATADGMVARSVSNNNASTSACGGGSGGDDARLVRMLEVQREMEAVTRRLVELSQTVLSCQQCVSQLIRGEDVLLDCRSNNG